MSGNLQFLHDSFRQLKLHGELTQSWTCSMAQACSVQVTMMQSVVHLACSTGVHVMLIASDANVLQCLMSFLQPIVSYLMCSNSCSQPTACHSNELL